LNEIDTTSIEVASEFITNFNDPSNTESNNVTSNTESQFNYFVTPKVIE